MGNTANQVWETISNHTSTLAEQTGKAVVAVEAGHRVAASGVHWKPGSGRRTPSYESPAGAFAPRRGSHRTSPQFAHHGRSGQRSSASAAAIPVSHLQNLVALLC